MAQIHCIECITVVASLQNKVTMMSFQKRHFFFYCILTDFQKACFFFVSSEVVESYSGDTRKKATYGNGM